MRHISVDISISNSANQPSLLTGDDADSLFSLKIKPEGEAIDGQKFVLGVLSRISILSWVWQYDYDSPRSVEIEFSCGGGRWNAIISKDSPVIASVTVRVNDDGIERIVFADEQIEIFAWQHDGVSNVGSFFLFIDFDPGRTENIHALSVTGFYNFLRDSVTTLSKRPSQFLLSAYNIQDMFATVHGQGFKDSGKRLEQLEILTDLVGSRLGLNTCSFDEWTWDPDPITDSNPTPISFPWSIEASLVQQSAQNHGISGRSFYNSLLFANSGLKNLYYGNEDNRFQYFGITYLNFFVGNLTDETLKSFLQTELPINLSNNNKSNPLPNLRHLVIGDEISIGDKGVLELLRSEESIGILDPFSAEGIFRSELTRLTNGELKTADFRESYINYLKDIDGDATNWGAANPTEWNKVEPINADVGNPWLNELATKEQRLLHFHTVAFLREQFVEGAIIIARASTEMIRSQPNASQTFNIAFGTNAFFGQAVRYRPDHPYDHRTEFSMDPFALARANAQLRDAGLNSIVVWMEDNNLIGYELPRAIGHAELLRSAAMLTLPSSGWPLLPGPGLPGEFGLYARIIAGNLRQIDEILYRTFTYIGKGMKNVDYFKFGLDLKDDSWGVYPSKLEGVRKVSEMISGVEPLLYEGRPSRSLIAILLTRSSEVWDTTNEFMLYHNERIDIATPLSHAGFSVDYIDEEDIVTGALTSRNYKVLYLTDPNLSANCVPIILSWVFQGGHLAVVPGAAVEDEYGNVASNELDIALGVMPRRPAINPILSKGRKLLQQDLNPNLSEVLRIRIDDLTISSSIESFPVSANFVLDGTMPIWHFQSIENGGAIPLATWVKRENGIDSTITFTDRTEPIPALTVHQHGKGQTYCFGIFPGQFYYQSTTSTERDGNTNDSTNPFDWKTALRNFALTPIRMANIFPSVKGRFLFATSVIRGQTPKFQAPSGIIVDNKLGDNLSVERLASIPSRTTSFKNIPSAPFFHTFRGALSIDKLTSRRGIALVVMNWERDPRAVRLTEDEWDLVEISLVVPQANLLVSAKSTLKSAVKVSVSGHQITLKFRLDTVDVITIESSNFDQPSQPQSPGFNYVLCDIGKEIWGTISPNGKETLVTLSNYDLKAALEAHMKF